MKRLTVAFILLAMVQMTFAYDFAAGGLYFNITSATDRTVEVTAGDVKPSGQVAIPSEVAFEGQTYSVTAIGTYAFASCSDLTALTIPNSIGLIDFFAFKGCDGLEELTIEDGTTILTTRYNDQNWYEGIFNDCPLKSVYIGRNWNSHLDMYFASPFRNSKSLTSITIGPHVNELQIGAFYGCSALEEIELPEGILVINEDSFYGCTSLKSIHIPASVITLGWYTKDASIDFENKDHKNVFRYCPSLERITVAEGNKTYDSRDGCNAIIVKESGTLLTGCRNTVIPESVKTLESAFTGCSTLQEISIPSGVTEISSMAFYGCTSLKAIDIPKSVNTIGMYAFGAVDGMPLDYVTVHWDRASDVACDYRAFGGDVLSAALNSDTQLQIPEGTFPFYKDQSPWKNFGIIAEGALYHINAGHQFTADGIDYEVIDGDNHLKVSKNDNYRGSISIPSTLTYKGNEMTVSELESWGFATSPALTAVKLPKTLKTIPENAFRACPLLEEVTFEAGSMLKTIEGDAFKGCEALVRFDMPPSIKTILSGAFTDCSALEHFDLPEGLEQLGGAFGVFDNCTSLQEIILPSTLTHLSDFCFSGCSSVASIELPASISNIGQYTFAIITGLKSFTAHGAEPPSVHRDAFAATSIKTATLYVPIGSKDAYAASNVWKDFGQIVEMGGDGSRFEVDGITYEITNAGDMTVQVCEGEYTGDVALPRFVANGTATYVVTGIAPRAFAGSDGLTAVTLSDYIESISEGAFYGCSALTKLVCLAKEPPTCGNNAFFGVNKYLATLYVPQESIDKYKAAEGWSAFRNVEPIEDTGISNAIITPDIIDSYRLNGARQSAAQKGVVIVRMSDGTIRKLVVK